MEFILSINRVLACVGRHPFTGGDAATKTLILVILWTCYRRGQRFLTPKLDAFLLGLGERGF
jgi:hypothetical protein